MIGVTQDASGTIRIVESVVNRLNGDLNSPDALYSANAKQGDIKKNGCVRCAFGLSPELPFRHQYSTTLRIRQPAFWHSFGVLSAFFRRFPGILSAFFRKMECFADVRLKTKKRIGLFLGIIGSSGDRTLAYRGTKSAQNSLRRENRSLRISRRKDSAGNPRMPRRCEQNRAVQSGFHQDE